MQGVVVALIMVLHIYTFELAEEASIKYNCRNLGVLDTPCTFSRIFSIVRPQAWALFFTPNPLGANVLNGSPLILRSWNYSVSD